MASDYILYRLSQVERSIQILRETLDRRFSPDTAVDSRFEDLDLELSLLKRELEKEKYGNSK